MKKINYYIRVIKRKKQMKRNAVLSGWAKTKKLNNQQLERAIEAILGGKSSFEE